MVYICIIKITEMGLTKFLKIVFKRISTYIKDKVKFLKISFNLFVMRSCFSRKKSQLPVKENDSFDKDFFWRVELGITSVESYYQVKQYYLSHILPKQDAACP